MRPVAIAMVLLTLPLATPALAQEDYDECKDLLARNPCFDLQPSTPAEAANTRYFLYLGWTKCAPQFGPDCMGKPNDNHMLPMNPVVGTLYQDTNPLGGLQRFPTRISQDLVHPADKLLLL